jgi:hypothetical protein
MVTYIESGLGFKQSSFAHSERALQVPCPTASSGMPRFLSMLLFLLAFASRLADSSGTPPQFLLPTAGIAQSASRRTPCVMLSHHTALQNEFMLLGGRTSHRELPDDIAGKSRWSCAGSQSSERPSQVFHAARPIASLSPQACGCDALRSAHESRRVRNNPPGVGGPNQSAVCPTNQSVGGHQ